MALQKGEGGIPACDMAFACFWPFEVGWKVGKGLACSRKGNDLLATTWNIATRLNNA